MWTIFGTASGTAFVRILPQIVRRVLKSDIDPARTFYQSRMNLSVLSPKNENYQYPKQSI